MKPALSVNIASSSSTGPELSRAGIPVVPIVDAAHPAAYGARTVEQERKRPDCGDHVVVGGSLKRKCPMGPAGPQVPVGVQMGLDTSTDEEMNFVMFTLSTSMATLERLKRQIMLNKEKEYLTGAGAEELSEMMNALDAAFDLLIDKYVPDPVAPPLHV